MSRPKNQQYQQTELYRYLTNNLLLAKKCIPAPISPQQRRQMKRKRFATDLEQMFTEYKEGVGFEVVAGEQEVPPVAI